MAESPDPKTPVGPPIRLRYWPAVALGVTMFFLCFFVMVCPALVLTSAFALTDAATIALMIVPAVVPAVLTAFGNLRYQRDFERRARGWCVGCGYDLRGSLDSERCPECGRRVRRGR